jgi:hypothetical protein
VNEHDAIARIKRLSHSINCADEIAEVIERLIKERDEVQRELNALTKRIGDASILLCDWDGYYNPETGKGNVEELAKLIEEGYTTLQGRSWRDPEEGR